jgi:hypothetical protein
MVNAISPSLHYACTNACMNAWMLVAAATAKAAAWLLTLVTLAPCVLNWAAQHKRMEESTESLRKCPAAVYFKYTYLAGFK